VAEPSAPSAAAEAGAPPAAVAEPAATSTESAPEMGASSPAPPEPAAAPAPIAEPRAPKLVALSSIISTTNQQMVDLNDPDVRRMLKELAKSEIDLAQQYKSLGQNIDAVLQLTEAKKICESLDMASHARLIDQMIHEVQP
jgi:hypothetical protein